MKTVKQIAEELNISKQAVRKHIANLPTDNYRQLVDGRKTVVVDDEGFEIIKNKVILGDNRQPSTTKQQPVDSQTTSNDERLIQSLQEQIEFLKQQLQEKDKQLSQQQVLTLQATKKIELLENKEPEEQYEKSWFGLYRKK